MHRIEGRPDGLAPHDQAAEDVGVEVGQARPQPDVRRVRALCLHPDQVLDGLERGEPLAVEEQLAGERGAVERPGVEPFLRHAARYAVASARIGSPVPTAVPVDFGAPEPGAVGDRGAAAGGTPPTALSEHHHAARANWPR